MTKFFRLIFASVFLLILSSCATRGIPLVEQTLSYSKNLYTKAGSKDGQDIYIAKDVKNISSQEIAAALDGTNQKYQLLETEKSSSFLLKEKNPFVQNKVVVIIGSNKSPTLVGSSLSLSLIHI